MKIINVTNKNGKKFEILVDDWNYEWLMEYSWCINEPKKYGYYYATAYHKRVDGKNKLIKMHRLILGLTDPNIKVDHKDRNGLNNQEQNIRPCTQSQNSCNKNQFKTFTSKYIGVSWKKKNNKWCVQISVNSKKIYIGLFKTEIEAALAYDEAAKIYHGEFANLNFKQPKNAI